MRKRRLARRGGLGYGSNPGGAKQRRQEEGRNRIQGRVRPDVAEQAAVLIGAMLLVLAVQGAPLAQYHAAEENKYTNGALDRHVSPSRHDYL